VQCLDQQSIPDPIALSTPVLVTLGTTPMTNELISNQATT
jgi:hypothetical protein